MCERVILSVGETGNNSLRFDSRLSPVKDRPLELDLLLALLVVAMGEARSSDLTHPTQISLWDYDGRHSSGGLNICGEDDIALQKLRAKVLSDCYIGSISAALFVYRFPLLGRCCDTFCKGPQSSE